MEETPYNNRWAPKNFIRFVEMDNRFNLTYIATCGGICIIIIILIKLIELWQ